MADLAARATSGAIWTYASYTTGRVLVFVGMAAITRLLRPDDYGLFSMAAVAINLLEGSYDLGLRRGLIYVGGAVGASNVLRTGFALALGTGIALSGLLYGLAPFAARFYGDPRVTGLMQVLSVYFGIACIGVVPDALLQQRLAFNRRFWPSVAAPAGRYLIAIPLALLGFGAWSLAWGQLIGITLEVVALLILARWRPRLGWSRAAARQLIQYSSQVSLVEWTAAIALNLDYVLVGHFLGSSVLGLYTLAFKLPDATIGAAGWIGSRVLLPALVELGTQKHSVATGFLQALRLLMIVLAPLAAGLCLLAPQLVPVVFGTAWTDAVPVVQLLAVAACVNGMLQAIGAAFMAAGQPRKIVLAQIGWIVVLIPLLYFGAQRSIVAVALAHVTAMLVFAAVKFALVPSTLRVRAVEIVHAVRPALAATAIMVAVLIPVLRLAASLPPFADLAVGVVTAAVAYGVAISLLHATLVWQSRPRKGGGQASNCRPTSAADPQRLNVVMVTQSYYPRIGGAETNLQSLIAPLGEVGVDISVLTRRFDGMPQTDSVAGAPVHRLPAPGGQIEASLTFVASTVWLLMRSRPLPDVIHAHELRSPTLAAVCAKFVLHRPVVAHVLRGGLLGDVGVLGAAPLGKPRQWLFMRAVDRFVAVSCETHRELLTMGVPDERIAFIPYGVDTRRFCPAAPAHRAHLRKRLDFEQQKVVLVVARLVPEKGFDRLLEAWPVVKAAVPCATLAIVGDGSERTSLERRARCLTDVRFVGALRDPLPYYQAADCFTLPSFTEGQPISLLEAMSTGLVCVATNIGGISDALADGQAGVLVPPGDVPRLAEALIRTLQTDEADRAAHGAVARREMLKHHSLQANAAALRRLYDELT